MEHGIRNYPRNVFYVMRTTVNTNIIKELGRDDLKTLAICPTKGNPKKLNEMLKSYDATVSFNCDLVVCLDKHDEKLEENNRVLYHYSHMLTAEVYDGKNITEIFNDVWSKNKNYDYYHLTNDDVVYETKWWDMLLAGLIRNGGIAYGDDGFQGENLCTFPMISKDIVEKIGWLQLPTLKHYCGDVVWMEIGKRTGLLKYTPNVKIRHNWSGVVNEEKNNADRLAFVNWLAYQSHKDIGRLVKDAS